MAEEMAKSPSSKKRSNRRTVWLIGGVLLLAACAVVTRLVVFPPAGETGETDLKTTTVQRGSLVLSASGSGTTAIGSLTQSAGWSSSGDSLVVAEVYKVAGNQVAEGDALLKLTEDSVATVKAVLEAAVADADMANRQAAIDREAALIQAEADYNASLAEKSAAKQVYNETVESLNTSVSQASDALTEAQAIIADYPALITTLNSTIAASEKELATAKTALAAAQADSAAKSATGQSARQAGDQAAILLAQAEYLVDQIIVYADGHGGIAALDASFAEFLSIAQSACTARADEAAGAEAAAVAAETQMELARSAMNQAQTKVDGLQKTLADLKQDLSGKERSLSQATTGLDTLKARYQQALASQKSKKITAEQDYQEKVLNGDNAATTHEVAIAAADASYEATSKTLEDSQNNLAQFLSIIGDGTIKAAYAGTLSSIGYEADDTWSAETAVATYINTTIVTVTVSVDQSDIAGIKVGDSVNVSLTTGISRPYTGKVSAITMTSASTSVSSVNYTVTVAIEDTTGALAGDQSAAVTFIKETLEDVVFVDQDAILEGVSGYYVQLRENDRTIDTPVTTGETNGQYTVVTNGLAEGDVCLVAGSDGQA